MKAIFVPSGEYTAPWSPPYSRSSRSPLRGCIAKSPISWRWPLATSRRPFVPGVAERAEVAPGAAAPLVRAAASATRLNMSRADRGLRTTPACGARKSGCIVVLHRACHAPWRSLARGRAAQLRARWTLASCDAAHPHTRHPQYLYGPLELAAQHGADSDA